MADASEILRAAAQTFADRYAVYGDNYLKVGAVFNALFPAGLTFQTEHDWNRAHIFMLMIVKITRYTENWSRGGHQDSLRDLSVYAAMMETIDDSQSSRKTNGGQADRRHRQHRGSGDGGASQARQR